MSNPALYIRDQLPRWVVEQYPRLVLFLEKYYEWLHRKGGFTEAEIDILKQDTSWLKTDLDKFLTSGQAHDFNTGDPADVQRAILEFSNRMNPGTEVDRTMDSAIPERVFDSFETADGEFFETSDQNLVDAPYRDDAYIQQWFKLLGFEPIDAFNSGGVDNLLLIRLIKHIHQIKGTHASINLFFSIFFDEPEVEIYLPKFDIACLDDNFDLDGTSTLRDDEYYNEYTYVVRVANEPETYTQLVNEVYMKYIHPSGFRLFIEKKA